MSKISLRIADLRKKRHMTQQELADNIGVFSERSANGKQEYLLRTRKGSWNDDYAQFLISQVWKIDKPVSVLDCGCGYGFLGLLLQKI